MKQLRLSLLSILVALALLPSAAHAQSRSDQAKKHQARTGNDNPKGTPIASLAEHTHAEPAASQTAKNADQHANHTAPSRLLISISRWAQIATAILLVIFTGGLLWTSYEQWRAMEKSLQVNQRAYVNVNRIERLEPETFDESMFSPIDFVIRNSGRTPAKNLLIQVGGEISKEPLGRGIPTDLDEIPRTPYHGMGLPPDTEHRERFTFPNAHLRQREVASGNLYASCWATISYLDHFDVWHLIIEPFRYDADTHTFDRHPVGYKEADRRYKTNKNQWRLRVRFRALIERFR
jgi:hypothetical protein